MTEVIDLKKEALIFLADIKEEEDPRDWAIRRAYTDMSRRTLHFRKGTSDEEKADLKGCAVNAIRKALEDLAKKKCMRDQDAFDEWHRKLSNNLCHIYNDSDLLEEDFTCGQAQKWINMTMKYLWTYEITGIEPSVLPSMKEIETFLHIPLDRKILKKNYSGIKLSGAGSDGYAWSKIQDYESYNSYQKEIREAILKEYESPIVFELKHWNSSDTKTQKDR